MKSNNVKIFITHRIDKDTVVIDNPVYVPIRCGATFDDRTNCNLLGDNTGKNISEKRMSYCELTVQYWAWKNVKCDYYGFCHYRRFFNFANNNFEENGWGSVSESYLNEKSIEKYDLTNEEKIQKLTSDYDVIVTRPIDVSAIGSGYSSIRNHWDQAPALNVEDFDLMLQIIDEHFPKYSKVAHEYAESKESPFCNMFIMRRDLFFEYAEWMFDVLSEFDKRNKMEGYAEETFRTPGHLGERLFGIYYLYLQKEHPEIRRKEVQTILFENVEGIIPLSRAFEDRSIPVVFTSSDYYVPMMSVALMSMLDNANKAYNYDIIILNTDISEDNRRIIKYIEKQYDNVSIRLCNVSSYVQNYMLQGSDHIGVESYYRFIIQEILKEYDKVIYLDSDIVVNHDISELYNVELGDNYLAAANDPDFVGQYNGAVKGVKEYVDNKLKLQNPDMYFQAGVLLLNEKKLRELHSLSEWMELADMKWKYMDQDILNKECAGKVIYLDMRWNVLTDCMHHRVKNVISKAPRNIKDLYHDAVQNPYIIHYAGGIKPWHNPSEDFGYMFWKYARCTPYYEQLLHRMMNDVGYWQVQYSKNNRWYNKLLIVRAIKCAKMFGMKYTLKYSVQYTKNLLKK